MELKERARETQLRNLQLQILNRLARSFALDMSPTAWDNGDRERMRGGASVDLEAILQDAAHFRLDLAQQVIRRALAHTLGDRQAAADALGVSVRSLRYLLREKK